MPTIETLLLFTVAACAANACPGPSMIFVTSTSLCQGRTVGFISALGLASGLVLHVLASTLGLSAIFVYSPMLFSICKYMGAIYLVYVGATLFKEQNLKIHGVPDIKHSLQTSKKMFRKGLLIETLNPKTSLFFMSFLPQFVETQHGSPSTQLFIFGLIFLLVSLSRDFLLVITGSFASAWFMKRPFIQWLQQKITGTLLIGLGVGLAVKD